MGRKRAGVGNEIADDEAAQWQAAAAYGDPSLPFQPMHGLGPAVAMSAPPMWNAPPTIVSPPPIVASSTDARTSAQQAQEIQRMAYQQAAIDYDQSKNAGVAPEVAELCEYHGIDERATRALDDEMKRRRETFENDMQALWIGLEAAKNPSGLLMIKIKEMRMGNFRGMSALDKTVQEFAKQHRLDAQAAVKLSEVLDKREDPEGDLSKLAKHLERSNKPSSLMMMMLRDLREGKPIKEPQHAAAIGSKVHEKELENTRKRSGRSRSRSRERRGGRDEGRRGGRGRSRSRDRDRDRDRERHVDRERSDRERSRIG